MVGLLLLPGQDWARWWMDWFAKKPPTQIRKADTTNHWIPVQLTRAGTTMQDPTGSALIPVHTRITRTRCKTQKYKQHMNNCCQWSSTEGLGSSIEGQGQGCSPDTRGLVAMFVTGVSQPMDKYEKGTFRNPFRTPSTSDVETRQTPPMLGTVLTTSWAHLQCPLPLGRRLRHPLRGFLLCATVVNQLHEKGENYKSPNNTLHVLAV